MKNSVFKILIFLVVSGSLMAQTKKEKQQKKDSQKNVAYQATKRLIESGNYLFDAQTTNSRSTNLGVISLESRKNSVIVNNGEVEVNLPFFGGGGTAGYNDNPGITYRGVPAKYEVEYLDKKRRSNIKINVNSGTERHNITLQVNYRRKTEVKVISSSRNGISYSGYIMPLTINSTN